MPFHIGQIDFREGCLIILVHQFKLYLKEENSTWYVLQLLQSVKCVLEHQNCKKRSMNFCWCLTMMTLMTLGLSCHKTIHMQYLSIWDRNWRTKQTPRNQRIYMMNNNSVAQETSTGFYWNCTRYTDSELEIFYDSALQIIANEPYNHIAWIITNSSEQVDKMAGLT